jgi:N-methylhydantoinase A
VRQAIARLHSAGLEAAAICFLHAYANVSHEPQAKALVQQLWPEVYVCTSCDVLAEVRAFERFAAATVNVSLTPIMDCYLERFERGVYDFGIRRAPHVMQSNGGAVAPDAVRRLPVNTFFSGPAGEFIINPGEPDAQRLPAAAADVPLPRDSVVSIRTPGGGGLGAVEHRDP